MSVSFRVSSEKTRDLMRRMEELDVWEADIEETFIRGSGKGGQKKNKTSSAVLLFHRPTGIQIRCEQERSQALNRFFARRELCNRVEEFITGKALAKQREVSKIRRQKARRSKKAREKILKDKAKKSEKKALRRIPG